MRQKGMMTVVTELGRFAAVGLLTYVAVLAYRRHDVPAYVPRQETAFAVAVGVALFAVSAIVSRACRGGEQMGAAPCAARPVVDSMPCEQGCDWIDRNADGTAKECECRNCRDCSWDPVERRCIAGKRSFDSILAEIEMSKDETTRRAEAIARERQSMDQQWASAQHRRLAL